MAKQIINIGDSANSGNGDPLRTAITKANDNFTELYVDVKDLNYVSGWGYYQDDETNDLTITTTPTVLEINGLGTNTDTNYLPLEIRGITDLWITNKVIPITIGDGYDVRVDFTITAKTGSPTYLDLIFDIGGGATPTIQIVNKVLTLVKSPPYSLSVSIPLFALSSFKTNGGQIFLNTDTGTVTISSRAVLIKRDSKDMA